MILLLESSDLDVDFFSGVKFSLAGALVRLSALYPAGGE
jgi:hypothetical protein